MKTATLTRIVVVIVSCLLTAPVIMSIPKTTDANGTGVNLKWSSSTGFPITWQMNPTVGSNVTGTPEQAMVFQDSFQQWVDVSTAEISFTQGEATAEDVIPAFDQINLITTNVTNEQFNSTAIGLAVSYAFTSIGIDEFGRQVEFLGHVFETDIMFSPDTSFSTEATTPSDRIDLSSVAAHEIGHLLGLDHSNLLSSTMFPSVLAGVSYARNPALDDEISVSTLYPSASFSSTGGTLSGTVRTTANAPVFGALVVAVDANGQAVASQFSDPNGQYSISGLPAGSYTVYAEPMNQPFTSGNLGSLGASFLGQTINSDFTVRFR